MQFQFPESDITRLQQMVDAAQRIVITCHVSPDGDALGSTLALWHVLTAMGKRPAVITPDVPPETLMFLPGARHIIPASRYTEKAKVHFQAADLVVCLDFNALMRVDKMQPLLEKCTAPKILIDHHLDPEAFADVTISRPKASSTCYLLYEVLKASGLAQFMTEQSAECIYTGMMTDTGNFSFNSNDPGLYIDIAQLLEYGIDKDRIYKLACDTRKLNQLELNAFAIAERMRYLPEHRTAIIALRKEDLERYHYVKGDTEGLVNVPLSVPEVVCSAFLRQDSPSFVKLSLRSKGNYPVNLICSENFGGGGHLNAAGGEFSCSLDEAVERFVSVLHKYDKYIDK